MSNTNNFSDIKKYAEKNEITPGMIKKVLDLINYAADNNSEFYLKDNGNLNMRSIDNNNFDFLKDYKDPGKTNMGDADMLNNLKNMFGMK